MHFVHHHFCPFQVLRMYMKLRGGFTTAQEQLFIFHDEQALRAEQLSRVLKSMIQKIGLNDSLYSIHSFRIGRTSDLVKFGFPIETVKWLGRWRSNAVYKYIRS